jgi:membrane protease YdiL (CAAX protease family)
MSITLVVYIALIGYVYYTIFYANHTDLLIQHSHATPQEDTLYLVQIDRRLAMMRTLLFIIVSFISLFIPFLILSASAGANADQLATQDIFVPEISGVAVVIGVLLTTFTTFCAYSAVTSHPFRMSIAGRIKMYNPQSWVHNTAIVMMLLFLTAQIILFLAQGGTEGMAQSIQQQGVAVGDLLIQLWLQVIAAFLGVGWAIRRNWNDTLTRLGLRIPTRQDLVWGIGGGVGLLGILWAFGVIIGIIITLFAPEQMQNIEAMNRANDSLSTVVSTLPLAFLLSATAAIGEEILFRGALQPIFGNVAITLFFVALHTQSILSPAIIVLICISLALGHIRNRSSTTAAIIAHFIYNFAQLLLSILVLSPAGI